MRKIKALIISLILLSGTSLFAKDFDWSQCWCNYGAGIQKGDKLLSVDAGFPWHYFDAFNASGWAIPSLAVDFQVAVPVWKLPFTFGGYGTFGLCHYDYGTFADISFGALANYHIMLPPKNLDVYTGIKSGIGLALSNYYSNSYYVEFDWGWLIGASWFFSDRFGLNLELGYPLNKFGMEFKF